jgi:peptide/nickel transport system permease protein
MIRFLARRIVEGLLALLLLALLVFLSARATGNPAKFLLPDDASAAEIAHLKVLLGLSKPLPAQFWIFLVNTIHGNLGTSFIYNRPVSSLLAQALPATMELAGTALIFAVLIGVPLGVLAAVRRGSLADRNLMAGAVVGMALPQFWLGLMLVILFTATLRWLPAFGDSSPQSLILPAVTLAAGILAGLLRLTRSSVLDVIDENFVTFAHMKGVSSRRVLWKHVLRNALIPVITFAGITLGVLLNGVIVVENVFAWPGLGRLTITAAVNLDFPVLQGAVLLDGVIFICAAFLVDVLYVIVDPRRRAS